MAAEPSKDPRWLLQPPPPGQVHLHIAIGEGVELSPEVKQAIEALARALSSEPEVTGHACMIGCGEYSSSPCRQYDICKSQYSCQISVMPRFGLR